MGNRSVVVYGGELYHHGILGQKWGVKNGPPYPLGSEDHSQREKKAGWRKSLNADSSKSVPSNKTKSKKTKTFGELVKQTQIEIFRDKYLEKYGDQITKKEATKYATEKLEKIKKTALIVGGTALVGLAAYAIIAYGRDYVDQTIKAGTTLQTLSWDPDRLTNGQAFYTNFRSVDKSIYEGLFGRAVLGDGKYKLMADVVDNLKVASPKSGEKVFQELLNNDKYFQHCCTVLDVNRAGGWYKAGYHKFNAEVLPLFGNESKYDNVNDAVNYMKEKFYSVLSQRGYSGVIDINDTRYSNLRGISPTIFFDLDKITNINNTQRVSALDAAKGNLTANAVVPVLHMFTDSNPALSMMNLWNYGWISLALTGFAYDEKVNVEMNRKKKGYAYGK